MKKNRGSSTTLATPLAGIKSPKYLALAKVIAGDIQKGRYAVGGHLPTEPELQRQFGVSRHTIREAMRQLQEQGYVSTHHGIGTRVRSRGSTFRFVLRASLTTLDDLLGFFKATRLKVIGQRELVADDRLADLFHCPVGQAWVELDMLRFVPANPVPIGFVSTYLRPEFADVVPLIQSSKRPVFTLVEKLSGVKLGEMEQEIASVSISPEIQEKLSSTGGGHGLQITRRFRDQQGRLTQISVGVYPSERLVHTAKMQIQRDADDEP